MIIRGNSTCQITENMNQNIGFLSRQRYLCFSYDVSPLLGLLWKTKVPERTGPCNTEGSAIGTIGLLKGTSLLLKSQYL